MQMMEMFHYKDNLYYDVFGRVFERYTITDVSVPTYGYTFTGTYLDLNKLRNSQNND